jgi:hypothetical protein
MRHSYNSRCSLIQIYRITCPHYQMKMITSTNIMQMNNVHHHHLLKQSWDGGQFWATWFKLKDEVHRSANLKSWCFYSWCKGMPLTSVHFASCLLVLFLRSCVAYVSFYTRWTALQDQSDTIELRKRYKQPALERCWVHHYLNQGKSLWCQ